jgi:hypothetical protein
MLLVILIELSLGSQTQPPQTNHTPKIIANTTYNNTQQMATLDAWSTGQDWQ